MANYGFYGEISSSDVNLKWIIKCHFPSLTGLQTNEIWCRETLRKRRAFYRRNFLRLQASRWQPIATQGRASHLRVSASTNANDAFMHEAERRARRFYALPRGRLLARARPPNLRSFLGYVFVILTSWVLQVFPSFCTLHISKREGENIFLTLLTLQFLQVIQITMWRTCELCQFLKFYHRYNRTYQCINLLIIEKLIIWQ